MSKVRRPAETRVQFRSAVTGQFTTKQVAERRPDTHVRERNQAPNPRKK